MSGPGLADDADEAPYIEPDERQQAAVSARYGLVGPWEPLPSTGIVHRVYRVGSVVVRIPRRHAEWVSDTRCEAVAAAYAADHGIATPRVRAFDDRLDILPVPFLIVDWTPGRPLALGSSVAARQALGATLAQLHGLPVAVPDPHGWLDEVGTELPEIPSEAGLDPDWQAWIDALQHLAPPETEAFTHNDVHEWNVLIDGDVVWLIDWGDAGIGDPAVDFGSLHPDLLTDVLDGYDPDWPARPGLVASLLLQQADHAARRLLAPRSHPHSVSGTERLARLAEVVRDADPTSRWAPFSARGLGARP